MTYEKLGEKYGPRTKTLSKHAKEKNWKEKRLAFQRDKTIRTQEKLAEIRAKEEAGEITKMNKAHYESQQGLKYLADKKIIADVEKVKGGQDGELSAKQIQILASTQKLVQESQRLAKGLNDKELNINLIYKQLTPIFERVVNIIEEHAPQAREAIIREFTAIFGKNVP
jgi:hypothetical protein